MYIVYSPSMKVVEKYCIWDNESPTYMWGIDFWTPPFRENLSWKGKIINIDEKKGEKGEKGNFSILAP